MKTAVIYARYSSDAQTEQSIEGQLRVCQEYAQKNDILILDTYIDRAMSGTNDMRPDFQRMIAESKKRSWNYVIVYKLDRFSRNKYESAQYEYALNRNGVRILSAMENIPDTPEGIILKSVIEGMNQYYSMDLAQKVKRGMRENRLKGNFQGGNLLYGYRVEGKKILINEDTAEIVRFIYEEYASGSTVRRIVDTLTARGISYRGKPFALNTIYGILKNEKYSGTYKYGEDVIDNMYPQIVATEIFEKVRAKINANRYGKKPTKVVYLLRNKMKCGYCGESLIAENGKSHNGEKHYYYKCHGRKNLRNGCKLPAIRKEELERLVMESILSEMTKPKTVDTIVKKLLAIQAQEAKATSVLSMLIKEKTQTENAINNLIAAAERGFVSNASAKRLHELESRLQELEKQIIVEQSKAKIKVSEKEIRIFYESALSLEPLMLIDYLIKEIIVYDDTIHIYYNTPLMTSPDEDRGFSFYKKTISTAKQSFIVIMAIA